MKADSGPVVVLTEGAFGRAVADRIENALPGATQRELRSSIDALPELLGDARFVGLALWRRYPEWADAVDAMCHARHVPWSGVTLDGRWLITGPLVVPGKGPCYGCYRKRWLTHLADPAREQALDEAYAADPDLGCIGFVPSAVSISVSALLLDITEANRIPGRVGKVDLLHCRTQETRVVGVHGCTRCGLPSPRGDRYVRRLRDQLALGAQ
jgi:bacteriocin biosynthesis cyclodehydratase domain-containing protein